MTPRRSKILAPTPSAVGDGAVAAGMTLVPSTDSVIDGEDEINRTRDYIAAYAKRSGPLIDIWAQPTDPGHKPGRIWIRTT